MSSNLEASFEHCGMAPFEVEALFSILNGAFTVQERKIERNYEEKYACMIKIVFPLEYNETFFEWFGHKRWDKIAFLLKEMRRRTGKKGIRLTIQFVGEPVMTFTIAMHEENLFESALEKMEILNELIELQTNHGRLPSDVEHVHYEFDLSESKWIPHAAYGDGGVYSYEEGKWTAARQSL